MVKKAATTKKVSTKSKSTLPAGGYEAMIVKAIAELGERGGSSPIAILKNISKTHADIPEDRLKLQVRMALKRMTQKEKLVKVKASYKLASSEKAKTKKAAPKKAVASKPKASKPKGTIKKKAPSKTKKATAKKTGKKAAKKK
mmetsp:Transcript_22552/g.90393  ORF Transcript_22552/g.90393 Transcript_22552/m.90393 type:complete len:143 (-) Transcript_22552:508-936(-)|eukprot:CAMPEP_0113965862 /NCGR_PEP_ID=MMETSP0011_2-20120614/7995_1 /TAXON_ID=101924 /ORGANISM="Rhodosorus marinus" /LENGTH=142 /DNA_ID=CAMNT_0000978451 /DNA_START=98 /DNA_END=526 /DNA_ORIENTATION=+ /assembly_acc=CAM_ASM_000156